MSGADDQFKRTLEDIDDATRQVSTNNRYISFGLIALCFSALTSDAPFLKALVHEHGSLLLLVGACGCAGVIFDYLHYSFSAAAADRARRNETAGHMYEYGTNWSEVVWRTRFYNLRTWAAILGAALLIGLVGGFWIAQPG